MTTPAQVPGFLAEPPSGGGRGVLVLHAWWGLNETIKAVCERLAEAGFIAFAPDLFRGQVATTVGEAEHLSGAHDSGRARADIAAAMTFLDQRAPSGNDGVAVVGFSFGAYYALQLSAVDPRVRQVVLFYGTGLGDHTASCATYLGHFAEADQFEPESEVNALETSLRAAGRRVTFHRYPVTGHWFFEPDRTDAYDAAAAALAWNRTLAFLKAASPAEAHQ